MASLWSFRRRRQSPAQERLASGATSIAAVADDLACWAIPGLHAHVLQCSRLPQLCYVTDISEGTGVMVLTLSWYRRLTVVTTNLGFCLLTLSSASRFIYLPSRWWLPGWLPATPPTLPAACGSTRERRLRIRTPSSPRGDAVRHPPCPEACLRRGACFAFGAGVVQASFCTVVQAALRT
eukprot:UN3549